MGLRGKGCRRGDTDSPDIFFGHTACSNSASTEHDAVFDSTENQALFAVCARKTIRTAAIAGIVWGAINLFIGFFAVQANVLNAGILVLGLLMLGTGVTAMRKPSLHSLLSEAVVSVLLLCWNLGITIFNARAGLR